MIYLGAVGVGILLACRVICWDVNVRKRTYEIRIKEVKERLTHNKLGTEPSGTAKKPSIRSGTE